MLREVAVYVRLASKDQIAEDREVSKLQQGDQEQIEDVDIKENQPDQIEFVKRPWTEWIFSFVFVVGSAITILAFDYYRIRGWK